MGPGFLSSGSPGPKRGVRQTRPTCPTMWHVLTKKRHTGPEERQGVMTQPEGLSKISRADGFQAKTSEECSSAARNPEPGPVVGATETTFPQKGGSARKAERSSQLLDDVKAGWSVGWSQRVRDGRRRGQGRESERHLEPSLGCHYPSWEVGATQML